MPLKPLNLGQPDSSEFANKSKKEEDLDMNFSDDDFAEDLGLDDEEDSEEENLQDDLGLDDEEDTLESDEEDLEDNDDEDDAEEDTSKEDEKAKQEEEEKARGKRENDRIRTLNEQKKAAEALAEKERKERIALQKQMVELQKQTVESTKSLVTDRIKSLKSQMVRAQEEGENEKYIDLHEELNKAQMDLSQLENWRPPEIKEEEEKPKAKTISDGPEALQNWVSKNAWFEKPKTPEDFERRKIALEYSEVLVSAGMTIEDDEFYALVDKKLEKAGLAKKSSDTVESKKDTKSSEGRKIAKKKISQTVKGASRTPTSKKASKNTRIRLTEEQIQLAQLYGMTPKEYADEMLRVEKSRESGSRMTTLKL